MAIYVQYDEQGVIQAYVQTGGTPPAPEHGRQISVPDGTSVFGKRVDLDTLTLVDCPEFAVRQADGIIFSKLQALDAASVRSMREFYLTGDKAPLQAIEDKAADLRSQISTAKK